MFWSRALLDYCISSCYTPLARPSARLCTRLVSIVVASALKRNLSGSGRLTSCPSLWVVCVSLSLCLSLSLSLFSSPSRFLSLSCCCVPHSAKSPPGNALHKIIGDFHIDLCIRLVVHWLLLGCSSSSIFGSISSSSRGSANVLSKPDQRLEDW